MEKDIKNEGLLPSSNFIDSAPKLENESSDKIFSNSYSNYVGRKRFYSHTNHSDPIKNAHSCGHAAIASMYDFYNRCPWPLKRVERGSGLADDGNFHFPDKLVDCVYNAYPPTNWIGLKFTSRESIVNALKNVNVSAQETYKGAFESGDKYVQYLKQWINQYNLPVLVLLDCHTLAKYTKIWNGEKIPWYTLHWGIVIGYDNQQVYFASWKEVFGVPWSAFINSWHCKGLPYPNNFYAIYTYPK